MAQGLLQQAVAGAMAASLGARCAAEPPFQPPVAFESVESRDLGYIDFLVPGIVGMTVMQLGLFGVAFGFVQLKRTGALRRLFATPTSPSYFLSAQVTSRMVLGYVQVAILIGIGIWFGLQMFGSWLVLAVIVGLALLIFLAHGIRRGRLGEERGPGRPGGEPHQPADALPVRVSSSRARRCPSSSRT